MAGDIEQLLQRTAVEPSRQLDAAQVVGRGRRRRRWRQGLAGGSALAVIAVTLLVAVVVPPERSAVDFDTAPPRTDLTGVGDWEVMAVGTTPVAGPSRIATDQEELDDAWRWFGMDGPAPVLPAGQGALVGSVAGDCDDASQVLGIERLRADGAAGTTGEFAAMHVDAECAFIDRFGTASSGPRTLYVIGVPVHTVGSLVGFEAVSAAVADLEWHLLTVEPAVGSNAIGVGDADQATLDWAWSAWGVGEEAPRVPEGWSAFAVRVPGSCAQPSQLRDVEAIGYLWGDGFGGEDGFGTVGLAVTFDPACAQREEGPGQPGSLYVIIVPADVAGTLHGPWPYITCEDAEDTGACAGTDRALIHTQW